MMSDERTSLLQAEEKEGDGREDSKRDRAKTAEGDEYANADALDVPILVRILNSSGAFRILSKRIT